MATAGNNVYSNQTWRAERVKLAGEVRGIRLIF
jgi:hypothetical protein